MMATLNSDPFYYSELLARNSIIGNKVAIEREIPNWTPAIYLRHHHYYNKNIPRQKQTFHLDLSRLSPMYILEHNSEIRI